MKVHDILQKIQFGNPVAEYDADLQNYFLRTDIFHHVVSGRAEVIAGDKGTGKTAIYQHLKFSYKNIPELYGVELLAGFNLSGEPLFRRLGDEKKLTEGQYVTVWKMYFLSLAGNWLLKKFRGQRSPALSKVEGLLSKIGLLSMDDFCGKRFLSIDRVDTIECITHSSRNRCFVQRVWNSGFYSKNRTWKSGSSGGCESRSNLPLRGI